MSRYKGNTTVQLQSPQSSMFDLSHEKRVTCNMGQLIPINIQEAIPRDKFRGNAEILLRLAPLLAPIYDQVILYVHNYFVPNRLIWEDWEEFITGGRLGVGIDPVTAPVPPYFDVEELLEQGQLQKTQLWDYMNIPPISLTTNVPPGPYTPADWEGIEIDAMPLLAYQRCWYDYYRDRNFVSDDVIDFPLPSGLMDATDPELYQVRNRDYLKDYFTASLPSTQRGVEVLMPLAGTGNVTYLPTSIVKEGDGDLPGTNQILMANQTTGMLGMTNGPGVGTNTGSRIENIDEVELTASSVSINDFRSAYALQVWLERNEIGGSRYTESIQAHFDVRPQDSRLQRAEYIGGGRINVKISEVVSTAYSQNQDDDTIAQGNLAGHGVTYGTANGYRYFCPEHGFIVSIMSIMPRPSYQQGLPRMFRRKTFLDYPWPTFAKLGEQPVWKWELFMSPETMAEEEDGSYELFGYQSRYAEWKQAMSTNNGDFRDTLLFWSLTRTFEDAPELGTTFLDSVSGDNNRIFAVQSATQNYWLYISNSVTVVRALPYFATPSLAIR